MSPSTSSTDRAEAIDAVAGYIRRREQAPRADRADPEIEAAEIVQSLMVRGWRCTVARPAPHWQPDPSGTPADPATARQWAAQARAALPPRPTHPSAEETGL